MIEFISIYSLNDPDPTVMGNMKTVGKDPEVRVAIGLVYGARRRRKTVDSDFLGKKQARGRKEERERRREIERCPGCQVTFKQTASH